MTDDAQALLAAARAAFPALAVDRDAFLAYASARGPLAELHAADLYLAFACLHGVPGALVAFEAAYGGDIARALRDRDPRTREDARQILHERLLVGHAPKLASYAGRGPLRRWLRVVARRILLELVERREPIADEWEVAALPVASDDPELGYLKARYRAAYQRAFRDALAELADRDRTVLAQYHVDGLTIDQLGALYRVHRVTASRWVTKAQDQLRARVVALLRERLGLSSTALRSVTRLVRSELSLSLARPITPVP